MDLQVPAPGWMRSFDGVARGLIALFGPLVEVAAHDVATDRVVGLWGATSGRSVGDPSLLADLPEHGPDDEVIGPYEKWSATGAHIVSVSVVVRERGEAVGMLCINFDRTPLETVAVLLGSFAVAKVERPSALFERDWREQIALVARDACRERGIDRTRMTREDRLQIVSAIDAAGLFATRNAASIVARVIGASRATVYALLKAARDG